MNHANINKTLPNKISDIDPFHVHTYHLGNARKRKRLRLQTLNLNKSGFTQHITYTAEFRKDDKTIVLREDPYGDRKVSGRPSGIAIVDIRNKEVGDTLGENVEQVTVYFREGEITVCVSANERRRAARRSKTGNIAVEIFSGGGVLSKFAEKVGFKMHTVVEREQKFNDVFDQNIQAKTICADVHDIDLNDLPSSCVHLQFGYPCTEYSLSNVVARAKKRSKCNIEVQEALEKTREADFLALALIKIIDRVNARSILIEEVEPFLKSLPFEILSYALKKMDYQISIQAITGSYTNRKRVAIVAIADDEPVDLSDIKYKAPRTIESHLLTPIEERHFEHIEHRPRESGARRKGLGIRSHLSSDLKVNTITTHFTRHTHPSLRHPTRNDYFSDFTLDEIKSMHGLPLSFNLVDTVTTARAVIGQGVCDGFEFVLERIFKRVTRDSIARKSLKREEQSQLSQLPLFE